MLIKEIHKHLRKFGGTGIRIEGERGTKWKKPEKEDCKTAFCRGGGGFLGC